jgi:phage-related protein
LIESTGGKAGVTQKQIEALSTSMRLKIGIDDDDVVKASNVLLTFTQVTGDVFDETMMRAADMSAVFGTDLAGSTMQLGKALNDPIKGLTALSRSGVSFTKEQKEQIKAMAEAGNVAGAQRLILDELGRQFGGTAEASASSTARISAAFGELKEGVGAGLIGALDSITPALLGVIGALEGPMTTLGQALGEFAGPLLEVFGPTVQTAALAFGKILEVVGAALSALSPLVEPLLSIFSMLVDVLAGAFMSAIEALAPVIEIVAGFLGSMGDALGETLFAALDAVTPLVETIAEVLSGVLSEVLPIILDLFYQLAPIVTEIGSTLASALVPFMQTFGRIVAKLAPVIANILLKTLEALGPVFDTIAEGVIALMPSLEAFGNAIIEVFAALGPILPVLADTLSRVLAAVLPLLPPLLDIVTTLLPPLADLVAALVPLLADGLAWTIENVVAPVLEIVIGALGFVADKLSLVIQWVADAIGKFESFGELVGAVWEGIKDAVSSAVRWIGDKFSEIVGFVTGLPGRLLALLGDLANAGRDLGKGFIDALIDALKATGGFAADIGKAIANAVIDAINWAAQKVNDFIPNSLGFGPVSVDLPDDPIPKIPRLANGSIVNGPQIAMIGEAGPEAIIPLGRPSRALDLLESSGLANLARANRGAMVNIERATFSNGTDAELVAQKVTVALSTRMLAA